MAKDKEGHGSEAHREGHKPQVQQGKCGNGTSFHVAEGRSKPHEGKWTAESARKRIGGTFGT